MQNLTRRKFMQNFCRFRFMQTLCQWRQEHVELCLFRDSNVDGVKQALYQSDFKHDQELISTLSQTTNFRLQTEKVHRRQLQIRSKWHKLLHMVEKSCGKRRNCSLRAISPFPAVFSKDLYCTHVKTRACLRKG